MLRSLTALLDVTAYSLDDSHRYSFAFAIHRCAIQAAAIAAVEYCWEVADDVDEELLCMDARRLLQSSDGDFLAVLDNCIPFIRRNGWPTCVPRYFDVPTGTGTPPETPRLRDRLERLIQVRNNRLAHGTLDSKTISESLDTVMSEVRAAVHDISSLLPTLHADNRAVLKYPRGQLALQSYVSDAGKPVIVRRFEHRGSTWRVRYQVLDPHDAPEKLAEISPASAVIAASLTDSSRLRSSSLLVGSRAWNPAYVLPARQTTDFEGRRSELDQLRDWWNDLDSRVCLVYGEGGIGKTTLVLEHLNSLLEGPTDDVTWLPEFIFYYSAKQTRWGSAGLEYLRVSPSLADAIREFGSTLGGPLGREWWSEDPRALVSLSSNLLREIGLQRDKVLFVIDNTETLARGPEDEESLADAIGRIARNLGRVIVTSRRREKIEARPIQVEALSDAAGLALLRRLGRSYGASPVIQAGDATLNNVCRSLGGKPLLIDVLARHVSRVACSIDSGLREVLQRERGDLGRFLFEDAWERMRAEHRSVFLVIGQFGSPIPEPVVGWACSENQVAIDAWLQAFEETRFGSVHDYGARFDIVLDSGAREYLVTKYGLLQRDAKEVVDRVVRKVRSLHGQLMKAESEQVTDRIAKAFITPEARAAKLAAAKGEIEDAIVWYEAAVQKDANNGALLDRFAWYLMKNGRLGRAREIAKRACDSESSHYEEHFTLGMILGRLGDLHASDEELKTAERLGKEKYLCDLQRARSRLEVIPQTRRDRSQLLREAREFLEHSSIAKIRSWRDDKHMKEVKSLSAWAAALERRWLNEP